MKSIPALPFFKLTDVPGWNLIGWMVDADVNLPVTGSAAPVSNSKPPSVPFKPCKGANVLATLTEFISPPSDE